VFYIILGCFLDGISMVVLTMGVILPTVQAAGIDLIWFGIFIVIVVEMAQITPPVGFNLFVLQGMTGKEITWIARVTFPFFLLMCLMVLLLWWCPRSGHLAADLAAGQHVMLPVIAICLGACVGALCRYGLALWLNPGAAMPLGTLAANLIGVISSGCLAAQPGRRPGPAHRRLCLDVRHAGERHRRAGGALCALLPVGRRPGGRASIRCCSPSWARCWAWCCPAT
jgi:hypothetical protein